MTRPTRRLLSDRARIAGPSAPSEPASGPDWRGWIALAWVVFWGWAYARMAIEARAPQMLHWVRALTE